MRRLLTPDGNYMLTGDGYDARGRLQTESGAKSDAGDARRALAALALCQNASVGRQGSRVAVQGDPLEAALIVATRKGGLDEQELMRRAPRVLEVPFSSELQRMTVVVREGQKLRQITKGAPETVLQRCSYELRGGRLQPMTKERRDYWLARTAEMGRESLRSIAVAQADVQHPAEGAGLCLLGVVGLYDPPRTEVPDAVRRCRAAGIRTLMVTGDHPDTAAAIARGLGILRSGELVAQGRELEDLPDAELRQRVKETSVFARVSPQFKLRLVDALRRNGEVVAMTGDGLNDAPALKAADIGVAMGVSGCDVTKEAADMVLSDDNFATIVAAVEEGRGIYDNIRKFVRYLLTCNVGEVLVMFLAALIGSPLPLLPIQILWVNLATDGLPALALGLEPVERDVLSRPPRPPREGIFARRLGWRITSRGTLIGLTTLGVFLAARALGRPMVEARTMTFATLVLSQLFHAFDCRSETRSLFELGFASNPYLLGAVASSVGLLLFAIYPPFAQAMFQTVPLHLADWLVIVAVSGMGSFAIALRRRWLRWRIMAGSLRGEMAWKSRS
ncbi:MAG: cation-transporting P-type ATPase [Thermaerobacter sp.]|nr:cation-transporting P-type ATPase [Thermaerobacter sp.]